MKEDLHLQSKFQVTSPPSMKFTILHSSAPPPQVFATRIRYELYFTFAYVHLDMMLRYSHRALVRNAVRRNTVDGKSEKDLNLHLHFADQVTPPPPINVSLKFTILRGAAPSVQLKMFAKRTHNMIYSDSLTEVASCTV